MTLQGSDWIDLFVSSLHFRVERYHNILSTNLSALIDDEAFRLTLLLLMNGKTMSYSAFIHQDQVLE